MANIVFRETSVLPTRATNTVKGTPLLNAEIDGNFALLANDVENLKAGTLIDDGAVKGRTLETLAGLAAGTYGDDKSNLQIALDDKGRITAITVVDSLRPVEGFASATYALNADLTTPFVYDDTLPQNTEGTEIISLSYTPKSATNTLEITFTATGALSAAGYMIAALFKDVDADAISTGIVDVGAADVLRQITFKTIVSAQTTNQRYYKVRVGSDNVSATMRLNGDTLGRKMGGSLQSVLTITEYKS